MQSNLKPLVGHIRFLVKSSCLIRPSNIKKHSLGRKPFVFTLGTKLGTKASPPPTLFVCCFPGDPCMTVSNERSREGYRKHPHHTPYATGTYAQTTTFVMKICFFSFQVEMFSGPAGPHLAQRSLICHNYARLTE